MKFVCESFDTPPLDWELCREVAALDASFLQSSLWAYVKRIIFRDQAHYLRLHDQSRVLAQGLVLQCWPQTAKRRRSSPLPQLVCLDGPSLFTTDQDKAILENFLRALITLSRRTLASSIEVAFPRASRFADSPMAREVFRRQGFSARRWATFLVDLTNDEEILRSKLNKAARKNLRRCDALGVTVCELTGDGAAIEYGRHYASIEAQSGRHAPEPHPIFDEPNLRKVYRYYVATDTCGSVLGCLAMYTMNGMATEIASTLSKTAFTQKIPAQDALHWHLLCEAKKMGCKYFDLAGVNPNPKTPKEEGLRRFKEKWGGDYVEYDCFERINPFSHMMSLAFQGASKAFSQIAESSEPVP